jgi:hypothetical protein
MDLENLVEEASSNCNPEADVFIFLKHSSGIMRVYPQYECAMTSDQLQIFALKLCILMSDELGGSTDVWVQDKRSCPVYQEN